MTANLDQVKEKIRRLLAVAENDASAEAEVELAMRLATQMMLAYQLERDDVVQGDNPAAKPLEYGKHITFSYSSRLTTWEVNLAWFIAEFVGTCNWYMQTNMIRRRGGKVQGVYDENTPLECTQIHFYGPDADARFCVELYEELVVAIATMARIRWGGFARGEGGSYAQGFVKGLETANRKEVAALTESKDSQTRALVLRSQERSLTLRNDAKTWLQKAHGIKVRKGNARQGVRRGFSSEAYGEGRADGSRYQLGGKRSGDQGPKQIGRD